MKGSEPGEIFNRVFEVYNRMPTIYYDFTTNVMARGCTGAGEALFLNVL